MSRPNPVVVIALAYAAGSVPISNLVARRARGVDLRSVGAGTVSGTALYEVAGGEALVVAGIVELAKGAVGPLLAGRRRPLLGAASAAAAVVGHNWSPMLRGSGGRGVSLLLGASAVLAPEGVVVLGGALAIGRLLRETGATTLAALLGLPVVLGRRRGWTGALSGALLVLPVIAKRLVGNDGVLPESATAVLARLVADREVAARPVAS